MENDYLKAVQLLTSENKFTINLGLDRMYKIMELLGNPQDSLKCIHVAGTNGKGSVCAIISTILAKSGRKIGLYTSPHIYEYTERIKILQNSNFNYFKSGEISKNDFSSYVFKINKLADEHNINLTEFETLTAVMFKYFFDNNVDIAVIETGLGGRFDATNIIKSNLCSIITHIDLDHTERLGNTKSEIAYEKAGIIKPDCPIFTCEGYEVIKDKADKCNSLFVIVTPSENPENLALKGTCQIENLSLALSAIRFLFPDLSEEFIQNALKDVKHPARFQILKPDLIVDASHNPNGALALRESLDLYYPDKERCFIFGCLKTKDYKQMMEILFRKNDEIYFYHFKHPNSCSTEELKLNCNFYSKEFTTLETLPQNKLKIICGSFYMLNELLPESLFLQ